MTRLELRQDLGRGGVAGLRIRSVMMQPTPRFTRHPKAFTVTFIQPPICDPEIISSPSTSSALSQRFSDCERPLIT